MSIFPHRPGAGQWSGATLLSLAAHGLLVLPFLSLQPPSDAPPPSTEERPPVRVVINRPDGGGIVIDTPDGPGDIPLPEPPGPPEEVPQSPPDDEIERSDTAEDIPVSDEELPTPETPAPEPPPDEPEPEPLPPSPPTPPEGPTDPTPIEPVGTGGNEISQAPGGEEIASTRSSPADPIPFGGQDVIGAIPAPTGPDLAPSGPGTATGADIATVTQEAATTLGAVTDTAGNAVLTGIGARRPARPAGPSERAGGITDPALRELIERIRSRLVDRCLVALARGGGDAPIEILMVADNDQTIAAFETAVLSDVGFALERRRELIDPLQCAALDLIRAHPSYPAFPVAIGLSQTIIDSGDSLTGVVRGLGGRAMSMLIIDDNGVAQNLQRFVTRFGQEYRFEIPMTRDGPARDTRQLLVVLATRTPLRALTAQDGQLAEDMFAALQAELAGQTVGLGLAIFDVD
jgi:hypothetical protein